MKTLALIGLPGCGKTSVGKELAERLGLGFADCDEEVERQAGMTIPALFEQEGEEGFRARETAVLYHLVVKDHYVVATGGGVVTRPENRDALEKCFTVFWDRTPENILKTADLTGRPLLRHNTLQDLYQQRRALYEDWADLTVDGEDREQAVAQVVAAWRSRICDF